MDDKKVYKDKKAVKNQKMIDENRIVEAMNHLDPKLAEEVAKERDDIPEILMKKAGREILKRVRGERKAKLGLLKITGRKLLIAAIIAILILVLTTTNLFQKVPDVNAKAIAAPVYPEEVSFYDYEGNWEAREEIDPEFLQNLKEFTYHTSTAVLSKSDRTANQLFSPISLYMALALAAGSGAGETQEEIFSALFMDNMDMEAIDEQTGKLFRSLFFKNEIGSLVLSNSLWLDQSVDFKKGFLENAAENYYAHSFQVDFKDKETQAQINQWIQQSTGGLLGKENTSESISPEQVMALINTVFFQDEWTDRFNTEKTREDIFYLEDGSTVTTDFMNANFDSKAFVRGEGYLVSSLSFKNSHAMIFVLPDEGISPYEFMEEPDRLFEVLTALYSDNSSYGEVIFKIPKFSYYSDLKLNDTLKQLGMVKAFDMEEADFSALSDFKPLFISLVEQKSFISIDEKGCTATAYTSIDYPGSAPPNDKAEMILNRPFLFAITGIDGVPLFVGIINNPADSH